MSKERDELAEAIYIATTPGAETDAKRQWDLLLTRTLQPRERVLAESFHIADALIAAGYRKNPNDRDRNAA